MEKKGGKERKVRAFNAWIGAQNDRVTVGIKDGRRREAREKEERQDVPDTSQLCLARLSRPACDETFVAGI